MRLLHTSDWHLGRGLAGFSRAPEHEAFLDELVSLAADVDMIIVSGDVFDTYNPPIDAEALYFDALSRLGDGGRRAVVVIAGNHDSPDRLAAPGPLAGRHGVFLVASGAPQVQHPPERAGRVRAEVQGGALVIDLPCGERAVVAALPYPSEARLRSLLSVSLEQHDRQVAYELRLRQVFRQLCQAYGPDTVNLATSHLAVHHCRPSESERALIGGAYQVAPAALPAAAQYVALGHLHMPQAVAGAPSLARYAGAPLAFRMSERDIPHSHCLVEVEAGGQPRVELVPVGAGRPLVRWEAGSFDEVLQGVRDGLHADAFIELILRVDEALDHTRLATLRRLPRDFVRVRTLLPEAQHGPVAARGRHELPVRDLFRAFYREQTGNEPDAALIELFVELAADPGAEAADTDGTAQTHGAAAGGS